MILVDSSVWIDYLRNRDTAGTKKLDEFAEAQVVLIGDIILLEVLQGARDDVHARRLERDLRRFNVVPLLSPEMAPRAARNCRTLRGLGITVRKTTDIIIGTYCLEHGHTLLHDDRDFDPMEKHLGLRVA